MSDDLSIVRTVGKTPPSSEARLHWLVYQEFPKTNAIVHFHDSRLLASGRFPETSREHPYGTLELARDVVKTLQKRKFIILKNHGALAVGRDMKACHALVEKAEKAVK
jgi:L-fuculose-phosphate aldolase